MPFDGSTLSVRNRPDGRRTRTVKSQAAILIACRLLMQTGVFQPTIVEIAKQAGVTMRTVFNIYGTVEALRTAALDAPTTRAILALVLRESLFPATQADCERLVRAVVHGRC